MQSTVEELRETGMKLAVCSNKPHPAALKVMDYLYPGIFDLVIGQQEGIRRKPAPDAPLLAAKKLGVKPEECMYIGDTSDRHADWQSGWNVYHRCIVGLS